MYIFHACLALCMQNTKASSIFSSYNLLTLGLNVSCNGTETQNKIVKTSQN